MLKKVIQGFNQIGDYLRPMRIAVHSAYTSFFLILSLFPMLVILFGVLAYTSLGLDEVVEMLDKILPSAFMPMAERLLAGAYENTSGAMVSLSAITALWSAGRGVRGLIGGLNAVHGVRENRHYLVTRSISMFYALLFVVVLVLSLVLHVFGRSIADYLRMTTNPFLIFLMDVMDWSFLLLLVIQTVLFTAMYAFLPNRHQRLIDSLPGAVVASLGWILCSNLFSLYVEYYPNYANIYGSFYAVALAMLWLYFCISIIFYGAALNRVLLEWKKR
ncbi:MAG: YihY/virulence factor BrkB family protein [Ruminococcaceae bacterium]|nr:YihY/virulence factor BrkB family protein [Oscillospiraceae bacterium]MBQ3214927.1 YihY/virulence factor BrkB family protein [Oscillospiraceae bacterium]